MTPKYDYTKADSMAMPIEPVAVEKFDLPRYEDYAARADARYAEFLAKDQGVAVWQRVRAAEVFRDGCSDMKESFSRQLGGLTNTLDYLTDAPTYLEPWYGIGVTASAFGAQYQWPAGQAPVVEPCCQSIEAMADLTPRHYTDVPIMRHTMEMIEYFLDKTKGRLPVSWTDLQSPINVAGELIDMSSFLMAFYDHPEEIKKILSTITDVIIGFTQKQSDYLGEALARPGHGFGSSRLGRGIGLSTDNLIIVSPAMYREFCAGDTAKIGEAFGGTAIHSCGNWGRWLEAVKSIPNLMMVDGAFSPQTDPAYNQCEQFRDALVNTGVILHARIVGEPEEVLARVKRLWTPGLKLMVGTHVQNPKAQNRLYYDIHRLCS